MKPFIVLVLLLVTLGVPAVAAAQSSPGALYERGARREMVKARAAYREACRRLDATRKYTEAYGASVGRWVDLSRRVGWPWPAIPNLLYIVNRESKGYATVVNESSGCTGLLQILPSNVSHPERLDEARYNLKSGLRLYREAGWQPWSVY